jgi:dipeptidyl-peptidase-4
VRWIEENRLAEGHPYWPYAATLPVPEYGTLKASDGEVLHYEILKPIGFDPAKKYPAIVSVYGGPHAQTVSRSWQKVGERPYLEDGYVIFKLDNRGSTNRSAKFKRALDRRMGTVEVEDQLAGAKFLARPALCRRRQAGRHGLVVRRVHDPDADDRAGHPVQGRRRRRPADRVGPLRHPLYRAVHGQAGREQGRLRRVRRPQPPEEPQAQQPAAAARHGRRQRHLREQHPPDRGLQKNAIPFEMMLYPGERHSAPGSKTKGLHVLKTHLEFFDRQLKGQ